MSGSQPLRVSAIAGIPAVLALHEACHGHYPHHDASRPCGPCGAQEDALLCGPSLEPFLRFAYVGAPWQPAEDWVRGKPWLAGVGGNGGLHASTASEKKVSMAAWSTMVRA